MIELIWDSFNCFKVNSKVWNDWYVYGNPAIWQHGDVEMLASFSLDNTRRGKTLPTLFGAGSKVGEVSLDLKGILYMYLKRTSRSYFSLRQFLRLGRIS